MSATSVTDFFSGLSWQQLIAERDALVNRIAQLRATIYMIDAELEANPPPANVCVGVWVPKRPAASAAHREPARLPARPSPPPTMLPIRVKLDEARFMRRAEQKRPTMQRNHNGPTSD